jgi:hypothetical protein
MSYDEDELGRLTDRAGPVPLASMQRSVVSVVAWRSWATCENWRVSTGHDRRFHLAYRSQPLVGRRAGMRRSRPTHRTCRRGQPPHISWMRHFLRPCGTLAVASLLVMLAGAEARAACGAGQQAGTLGIACEPGPARLTPPAPSSSPPQPAPHVPPPALAKPPAQPPVAGTPAPALSRPASPPALSKPAAPPTPSGPAARGQLTPPPRSAPPAPGPRQ